MKIYNYIIIALTAVLMFVAVFIYPAGTKDVFYCSIAGVIGALIPYIDTIIYKFKYGYTQTTEYLQDVALEKKGFKPLPPEDRRPSGFFHSWHAFLLFSCMYFIIASKGEIEIYTLTGHDIRPWFWLFGISFMLGYVCTLIVDIFAGKGLVLMLTDQNYRIEFPWAIPSRHLIQLPIFIILFLIYVVTFTKYFLIPEESVIYHPIEFIVDFIKTTWNLLTTGHR